MITEEKAVKQTKKFWGNRVLTGLRSVKNEID